MFNCLEKGAQTGRDYDGGDCCVYVLKQKRLYLRASVLCLMDRSCWRRVEDLEDEEASLNHRFMKLEKLRRRERLEVC